MSLEGKKYNTDRISLSNEIVFEEVFDDLYIPLVVFAKGIMIENQMYAEDIVQDLFTNLLLSKKDFENRISLKSYLYISVKNACLNSKKHAKVRQLYAEDKQAVSTLKKISFFDKMLEEEVYSHLLKALDKLPKRCKEVFELSLKGYKNDEIAHAMKISLETVKSQKKRGKLLLSSVLKNLAVYLIVLSI